MSDRIERLEAVAKAARDVPVQHEARCAVWVGVPTCDCRVKDFVAALANLERGAT